MTSSICTREGCKADETGICLEGFDAPVDCPYAQRPDDSSESKPDDGVGVYSADALTLEEAGLVCRSGPTKVVLLAGPISSGKTTIITSIYESFLDAPYSSYVFAGSHTLLGFERRCHLGRSASGGTVAATTRTSARDPGSFLHLRIRRSEGDRLPINLLFADISGEIFRQVRDSDNAQHLLPYIARVDHLSILLDGERLSNPRERQVPRNDARSLLRALLQSGKLHRSCRINIVFTKWDKVQMSQTSDLAPFLSDTKRTLIDVADGRSVSFHEVAARPESPSPPFAFGLAPLMHEWSEPPETPDKPVLALSDPAKARREAERYGSRLRLHPALEAFRVERY